MIMYTPFSKDWLLAEGFEGFVTFQELLDKTASPPERAGVYMIYYNGPATPVFVAKGTGGFFKRENPDVDVSILSDNWVPGAEVLYVGKAGGKAARATLKSRLKQYLDFGCGKAVGHRGGKYIWQLENPYSLVVCWRIARPDEVPGLTEKQYIALFISVYRKMPFANRTQ